MPTPSLLIVPARFKTGKLYSQIPTSGAGDFTVTRNTEARRVGPDGLIASVASGIPRLDYYTSGGTAGCPALLVEPSGTNLCLQSQDFSTTWTTQFGATVNTNTAISPDGTQNADTINLAAQNDSRVRQSITVANSTTYTMSCFYKNIALTAGQTFRMRFNNLLTAPNNFIAAAVIDLAAGTATYSLTGTATTGFSGTATGRIENYGNGWYRVSVTFTVGTGGGAAGIFEAASIDPGAVRSFYAWGAQLETGSVATSYIPTTTGTGSRSLDLIQVTGAVSGSIGQTEGVLYIECESNDGLDDVFFINRSTVNGIALIKNANNSYIGRIYHSSATITMTSASGVTGMVKIAIAYKSGDSTMYLNGSRVDTLKTNAITFSAALNSLGVNKDPFFFGAKLSRIRAVALYNTRLTDAELATLTTP